MENQDTIGLSAVNSGPVDYQEILWDSTTSLIKGIHQACSVSVPSEISFRVGKKSPTSELFLLGKFFSILLYLKHSCNIAVHVVVEDTQQVNCKCRNIIRFGFLDLLNKFKIDFSIVNTNSRKPSITPQGVDYQIKADLIQTALNSPAGYNCVVVPFSSISFSPSPSLKASDYLEWVEKTTEEVIANILNRINSFVDKCVDVKPEIAKAVLPVIRELVSNCVQHSPCPEESEAAPSDDVKTAHQIIFAVACSREYKSDGIRVGRTNSLKGWEDKFDILVQDLGQGIQRSVRKTFNRTPNYDTELKSPVKRLWGEGVLFIDLYKEQQLLSTVFRGNLVVRKGRKSLGLQSIASMCMRQNAYLNFHSGSTEVLVGERGGALLVNHREKAAPYWLPGVIASVHIPIHGMKVARARMRLDNNRHISQKNIFFSTEPTRPILREELVTDILLPKGLFGGLSRIKTTRRSETDAMRLLLADSPKKCQVIDLKASGAVDTDFLDSLIQEMCKSWESFCGEEGHLGNHQHPFSNRIFINVPRSVISALKERNCNSFLIENGMICLLTDEHDQPHFLGIKRATTHANDLEDLLMTIYMSGNTGISEFNLKRIGFKDQVLDLARSMFPEETAATSDLIFMLYYRLKNEQGDWRYVWRSATLVLWHADGVCARLIEAFTLKLEHAYAQMRNGNLIDRIYDFPRFWSDDHRLRNCAKRLSRKARFPLVKQIISFKGNGDVLAGAIRDVIGAPELLLLDIEHIQDDFQLMSSNVALVVDALLPGDERSDSYIGRAIGEITSKFPGKLLVLAFANMTQAVNEELHSCRVVSLRALGKNAPEICADIDPGTAIYSATQIHENFHTSNTAEDLDKFKSLQGQWLSKFSPLELSSEFWHNVAELKIIAGDKQRGDSRQLLYFEDNEAVIRHPRLREQLIEFVENYVRNILELRLEVILHPNHSTGAYLAHLVAKNLTINPLILPLTQPKYGGPIQVTSNEFRHLQNQISDFRTRHMGRQPRCLIIDDSILTGGSIFTMLGFASQLDIKPVGILVLINRLKPEISEALALLSLNFAYFLRFHIPKLEDQEEPNARLAKFDRELDKQSQGVTSSYFAKFWSMNHIRPLNGNYILNHLQRDIEKVHISPPRISSPETLFDDIKDKTALQIIYRLLLHPDTRTIDFTTRIAIVFNFLDRLLYADREFKFLSRLYEYGKAEDQYSQTNQLLRKILFLFAFSRPVLSSKDNKQLADRCGEFVDYYMNASHRESHVTVLCEAMMCLGALSSTSLLNFLLKCVANGIVKSALAAFDVPEKLQAKTNQISRDICGSLSWAIAVLLNSKNVSLNKGLLSFKENFRERIAQLLSDPYVSMEERFFLIETIFPVILHDKNLQDIFGVSATDDNEDILAILNEQEARKYLTDAPGYTVTLRIALHLFAADSVFLIAWTEAEKKMQLKGFESRNLSKTPNHEIHSRIPESIQHKMLNRLYLDAQNPTWLDELVENNSNFENFVKCFGVAVEPQDGLNYYIFAAYTDDKPSLPTAYYYWLRYEPELRSILHHIHVKYVQSSITWDLLRTSHKVFHPPRKGIPRRDALRTALQETPVGQLLNEVVALYSHCPKTVTEVQEIICEVNNKLEKNVACGLTSPLRHEGFWPVSCMPPTVPAGKEMAYIAFSVPVLKFILLECLCNASSFLLSRATVRFTYLDEESPNVLVKVTNDVSKSILKEYREAANGTEPGTGVEACQKAATAANGKFEHTELTSDVDTFTATLTLPVHAMPEQLWRFMK